MNCLEQDIFADDQTHPSNVTSEREAEDKH